KQRGARPDRHRNAPRHARRRDHRSHPDAASRPSRRRRRHRRVSLLRRCRIHHRAGHLGQRRHGMSRRVVVTGMAGLCPLGQDWATVRDRLHEGRSGIVVVPAWSVYNGLDTRLAAPVAGFCVPDHYPRKKVRSMGRVALLATRATELALADAGLLGSSIVTDGTTGIAYGSTSGSPPAMEIYAEAFYMKHSLKGIAGTDYLQFMSPTCAANLAQF